MLFIDHNHTHKYLGMWLIASACMHMLHAHELTSTRALASHCQPDDSIADFSSASEDSIFLHI